MANTATLTIDKSRLLAAIVRSPDYKKRIQEYADERIAELEQVAGAYYQAALEGVNALLQTGVKNGSQPHHQIKVKLPNGRITTVQVDWRALSAGWLAEKRDRSAAGYKAKNRSHGADLFWLDQGKLRAAFAGWMPGRAGVHVSRPKLTASGTYQRRIEYRISFNRLTPSFLDIVLRRALIAGASAGNGVVPTVQLVAMSSRPQRGVWRAYQPEIWRPTMRPLAMRLGKAMQQQILKTLNRR